MVMHCTYSEEKQLGVAYAPETAYFVAVVAVAAVAVGAVVVASDARTLARSTSAVRSVGRGVASYLTACSARAHYP